MTSASTNHVYGNLNSQIGDVKECLEQGLIKIIPIGKNMKIPTLKNYYNKDYSLKRLQNHGGNYGIAVGYNHEVNGKSISVIDIDGYTCPDVDEVTRKLVKDETSQYIYDLLKDIPGAMIVKTQSGGHHIYLWNETISDKIHETSKNLHFPMDFHIKHLRGKSLGKCIEIFTKWQSKQCVLPGSIIKPKGSTEIRDYSVESVVNNFLDIATVHDINETVKSTLISKGFTYNKEEPVGDDLNPFNDDHDKELKNLTKTEIKETINLLTPHFEKLVNQKHDSYLELGGYFCKNITESSCKAIVKGLLKATNDDYPKHIRTACANYHREAHKKGLNSLLKSISETNPSLTRDELDRLRFDLQYITNPTFQHSILVKKFNNNKKKYLTINFNKNEIGTYTFNKKLIRDNAGEVVDERVYYTDVYPILNIVPIEIYESFNILDKKARQNLCFTYYRKGMPWQQTVQGDDIENVEKQLKKIAGVVLKPREYNGIISEIIREYVRLDKIHTVEDIPVPGIFINPLTGELARSNGDGSIPILQPSVAGCKKALEVLKILYEFYPGDPTKLSYILRYCMILPFSFIYKTMYNWVPLLFLYGASRTSKTTLAEIGLCLYTQIDDDISIGGGAFDTPYRIGTALSRQGYGVIVNEPGDSIEKTENLDIIKRSIENEYCREKMLNDIHTKIPAYCNMIFTSNSFIPAADAFVRRSGFIEFTKSERMTEQNIKDFREHFHHVNWSSTDFNYLRSIGDFIVFSVHENIGLLKLEPEVMVNQILNDLFEYCDLEPFEWLYQDTELMDISSSDDDILDDFRNMIMKDYIRLTSNSNKLFEEAKTDGEVHLGDKGRIIDLEKIKQMEVSSEVRFEQLFTTVVMNEYIPYLRLVHNRSGNKYVAVNSSVGKAMKNYSNVQVTCKAMADYMNEKYKLLSYKGGKFKGFKVSYQKFRDFLKG
jgi:hypothetical protein